jgi:hypothetical protein
MEFFSAVCFWVPGRVGILMHILLVFSSVYFGILGRLYFLWRFSIVYFVIACNGIIVMKAFSAQYFWIPLWYIFYICSGDLGSLKLSIL